MMKKTSQIFALGGWLLLSGCGPDTPEIQIFSGFAQGTTYSVSFWTEQPVDGTHLAQMLDDELQRIDQVMSNYRSDSVIEDFNRSPAGTVLHDEIQQLMQQGLQVHQATQGCYDPTSLPLFELWGFADRQLTIPTTHDLSQTLSVVGLDRLPLDQTITTQVDPPVHLDLSSIGQGYAVAQLAQILQEHGIEHHLVEIGGEMMATGHKPDQQPWRIGVEKPIVGSHQINAIIAVNGTQPTAVMTSGTYRHYHDQDGTRYSHIIDPRNGRPVTHQTVAVTVLMADATLADAWSTGLLCLGAEAGMAAAETHGIAAVFFGLTEAGELHQQLSPAASQDQSGWRIQFID
ncbi:FAD:protein FMN transferase [Marinicella meishanensis]|uniref:FAD:protein FMN transferase n=1 Tax=Marinicella meishanensis TaxID=2873263 RepID=UPI001CBAB1EF|nr:FAD:protein FMN transferase [Marinicella sp. NBU2979]